MRWEVFGDNNEMEEYRELRMLGNDSEFYFINQGIYKSL